MASLSHLLTLAHQQYRNQQLTAAQQTCGQILAQAPDSPEALALMGCVWHGLGQLAQAEACWQRAVQLQPDYAEAHNNLGAVLQARGDLDGAIAHYQQAIAHQPTYAEAYCNLGNALQMQAQFEAAITHYQRAIQLKPDYAEAHSNLGTAYQRLKRFDDAIAHYQQALALRSDYPETHYNWGRLLEEQENFTEAESHYRQAIALKPDYAAAHNQLGYRLQQRNAYAEAESHYRQAIALGFDQVDTHHCLAVMLHNQGHYEAAIAQYQATIARKPDHGHAHLNRAIAYLTLGEFPTGWREYEWRWQVPEFQALVFSAHTRWEGDDLNGRTILLHSEQGLGDTIQFVRYATLVAQRGGQVLVSCPDPLKRLLATVPGVSQVVDRFVPNHLFHTYAALMSLPYLLGTTVDTIPASVPYLRASTPPPITLTASPHCRLKVGLVWSGNSANGQNFRRSCPLMALARLWQRTDIAFYSLQKELSPEEQAALATLPIQDLSPYLGDFADTAAVIDQLDLVISVDTSVAHLAGAMAKPVWLLLADVADWRWLLDREDSPWYPTMRLFRQRQAGNWDEVVGRIAAALSDWDRGKEQAIGQHKDIKTQRHEGISAAACDWQGLAEQGMLALREERWAAAIAHYQQALPHHPQPAAVHFHLGYAHQRLGQTDVAASHYQAALTHQPNYPEVLSNLGYILVQRSQWDDAIAHFRQAIALKPEFEDAHHNLAIALLTQGNFAEGWAEQEWRWQVRRGWVTCPHPRWDGSDLQGQTILLHSEQGLGDAIQFVRYVALVVAKGGRVLLQCRSPLVRLFAAIPGVEQVFEQHIPNHLFQVHAPLMSLPYILGTRLETIPATVPYLQATTPPPLVLPQTSHRKIGLVWSGNPNHPENGRRSCSLTALQPLLQLPGLSFYSLQKEVTEGDRALFQTLPIYDLSSYLGDFADTAALIDQLDWVISVDTSVAHLAGAMAKPVWLLLADVADWRWLLEREDSPWYPTMRLFRQRQAGNWDEVIARVVQALQQELLLWGRHPACLGAAGTTDLDSRTIPQAVELIQNSKFKIQNSESLAQQGMAALRSGQWERAIAYYQQALPDSPQPADIHFHLGYAYHQLGQENQAMEQYQRALSLRPEFPEVLCNLGNLMQARNQWETAIAYYHRALSIAPHYPDAHNNLGTALFNQGQLAEAIAQYQQALQFKPDHLDAHYNLGNALVKQGDLAAAIDQYQQVLAQNPQHIGAAHNLGSCLFKQGEMSAAIGYFQQVLALDPHHVDAHFSLAIAWLIQGDLPRGFAEYEWRWQTKHFEKTPPTQPQWDGSDLAGRTILLHPEQGYGDLIQFIRYAPLVAARGGRVIVCCPESLQRLFASVPGIDRVLNMAVSPQDFEICAPLLSLPRLLGTTLETIPATVPYLQVPPDTSIQLTPPPGTRLKVGLVWAGSPDHPNDAQRSFGLRVLWPLLALSDIAFYSLQVGSPALALGELPEAYQHRIIDLSPQLTDFGETAAAIAQLDLVITVDTSVAHLAGALAKPVWVLLSYVPDWRWLLAREDSPWYPTMRLFRQPQLGDWAGVITQVVTALKDYADIRLDKQRQTTIAPANTKSQNKPKKQSAKSKKSRPKADKKPEIAAKPPKVAAKSFSRKRPTASDSFVTPQAYRANATQQIEPVAITSESTIDRDTARINATQKQTLERLLQQGTQALEQQDWPTAIALYQQAIAIEPNLPRTLSNLGVALQKAGNLDAAIPHYQAAIRQKPDFPEAHHNLGKALQGKGELEVASYHYRQAIALNPAYAEPYYGLASILSLDESWENLFTPQDKFEQIKTCYEQLLTICPQEAAAYNNLGSAYFRRGKIPEAITYFEQAIGHDPHLSAAHRNLGLALLTQGDLVRGFAEYRWRWQVGDKGLPNFGQPQWDGSDLTGKMILLYPEQGHGDIVQFVRYAPLVAQRGGRVIVLCYPGLKRLIASVEGVDEVVIHHEVDFDTFFPLMDLPIIFKTDISTVPAQIPYLKAPEIPPLILRFPAHIRLAVGIVWAGNPKNPTDQKRSCPLSAFLPLLALENIAFYSLQVGGPVAQLSDLPDGVVVPDLSPHLKDFADTAAVIEQLDLVITVDTAVAHVAGALGKPTWILLSALPDWRWLLERDDSPWYPTVRLFRQSRLGDWSEVITQVAAALTALRDTHPPPDTPAASRSYRAEPNATATTILPRHHETIAALTKQGNTYLETQQWDAAITCFQQAILVWRHSANALQPAIPKAYYSLGWLYKQKLYLAQAEQHLRQAIALAPDFAEAHFTLGTTLLLRGDWLAGWEEYEWRFKTELFQRLSTSLSYSNKPCLTDRSTIAGKRILICKEQGLGDQIQFLRYALLICQLGGTVIIACSPELKSLFEKAIHCADPSRTDVNIVTDKGTITTSEFDEYISLMSLPKLFGTTPDSVPLQVPYLFAPEISPIHLEPTSSVFKIGIVWAGNPMNQENEKRSCILSDLLPLLSLKNIDFYSLQVGEASQQMATLPPTVTIHDLSPQLRDFADTAAAIDQLDLVITVDTAVAHLAGALGKPVWVLLAYLPDWRWLLEREDSPWYPTMRLFRQTTPGDWAGVIQRVKAALEELLSQTSKVKSQNAEISTTLVPVEVLVQQGTQCVQHQDWAGAIRHFQAALHRQPNLPQAARGLAWAFQQQGQLDLAIAHYQQAIALAPNAYELYINLGSLLAEDYRLAEAITYYQRAIQLRPDLAPAYSNLANAYQLQGDLTAAIAHFKQALAITPDLPEANYGLGTSYLLQGDFLKGWAGYEWRFQVSGFQENFTRFRGQPELRWHGSPLQGKRILLGPEQGFGDKIQFVRYAALIADRGGQVIVGCHPSLHRLLATAPGVTQVCDPDGAVAEFDVYISLMSLPYVFGTTLATIPASVPYLQAPANHPVHLEAPLGTALKIGIVWAGNPQNTRDRLRSCPLQQYLPLLQMPNLAFYSLQVGPASQQLGSLPAGVTVQDLSSHLHDFADTAAVIAQLDLVITVDTAVAHLAGALAKPVWVLLSHVSDWRWLLEREDSPWYPTMRLFRQTQPGDWAGVIQRVQTALQEWRVQNSKFKIQNFLKQGPSESLTIETQPKVIQSIIPGKNPETIVTDSTPVMPKQLAIDWSMQLTSGWGVYGFNLALQLLRTQTCQPVALRPPLVPWEDLNPLYQRLFLPYFQSYQHIEQITTQHPGQTIALAMPVLQALGNNFVGADRLQAFRGDRTVGVIFSENTHFTPDALAIAQQYDWIIAGSHWNEAVLRQHGLTRVSTVLQGIDPTYFHPASRLNLFPDRFVIFSGGKLEYRKGQDIIVAAFKHFQQRHPEALLITAWQTHWPQYMSGMEQTGNVIGLPEMGSNRQLAILPWLVRNGIPAEAAIDLGMVPNHQMPQILREADVAVFTNRAEGGTNLVAMECLATGLPTILSANTGHLDLIREDLGTDHCYGLRSQGPVRPNAHFPAVDGWGESAVEEVLEQLEAVYQHREVAQQKGERAAQFMRSLTWANQIQALLQTLGHLYT